jgi:cell surface protein SprA
LSYEEDGNGNPTQYDQSEYRNYVVQRQINSVSISEQLSPLVGFDMTLKVKNKNQKDIDPQIRIEWSKDRTATLGLSNFQITESKNNSLIFGVGYTIPEVPNPFINRRKGSKLSKQMLENSPLNIRADVTIRDNVTIIRKMVERQNQVTAGQRIISIKTSADLSVSDKLTVRFFYDHQLTRPKISTSFPTANINSGLSLRFQLTQ